jgi:hypothetical protein
VTCIDELDIDLFVKALELRRKFLNEKVTWKTERVWDCTVPHL